MDVIKHTATVDMKSTFHVSWLKYKREARPMPLQTHEAIATAQTFLRVTTYLYLNFKNRAKSLSILMAVIVHNDTAMEMVPNGLTTK